MPASIPGPRATLTLEYLCSVLERAGLLSRDQVGDALSRGPSVHARLLRQRTVGARKRSYGADDGVHPAEVLAGLGLTLANDPRAALDERSVMQALATHVRLPFVDLDPLKIDAKLAPQLLSRPFARRHGALVIDADDRTATVAVSNPLDHALVEALQADVRREPRLVVAAPSTIQRLITDFYGFRGAVAAAEQQASAGVDIGNLERYVKLKRVEEIEASDSHVVSPLSSTSSTTRSTSARATSTSSPGASTPSCECESTASCTTCTLFPKVVHAAVVSRIKTLARLDIAEKRRPQDGRIKTARGDREVEMRVSTHRRCFR